MKKQNRKKPSETASKVGHTEKIVLILLAVVLGAFLIAAAVIGIVTLAQSAGNEESVSSSEEESGEGGKSDEFVPEDYETEGDFRYTVSGDTASVYQYMGTDTHVTVPDTLGGYTVTEISGYSFYNPLTEVTLPKSIIAIGEEAFVNSDGLTVRFLGTTDEWNAIIVDVVNPVLDDATVICTDTEG